MGLFKCAKCECVENTALGLYWTKHNPEFFVWSKENEAFKGKPLCSECAPEKLTNGNYTGYGSWHDRFEKKHISTYSKEEQSEIHTE